MGCADSEVYEGMAEPLETEDGAVDVIVLVVDTGRRLSSDAFSAGA